MLDAARLGERAEPLSRRPLESVDGLVWVADRPEPGAVTGEEADESEGRPVEVLDLVDEEVVAPFNHREERFRLEEFDGLGQEVAEVVPPEAPEPRLVGTVDPGGLFDPLGPADTGIEPVQLRSSGPGPCTLRVPRGQSVVEFGVGHLGEPLRSYPLIFGPTDAAERVADAGGGVGEVEQMAEPERRDEPFDEAGGARLVDDLGVGPRPPAAEDVEGQRVEGVEAEPFGVVRAGRRDALAHLLGRSTRERDGRDGFRLDALIEEPSDAGCERRRLPRAGAGYDEERAVLGLGRPLLRSTERGGRVGRSGQRRLHGEEGAGRLAPDETLVEAELVGEHLGPGDPRHPHTAEGRGREEELPAPHVGLPFEPVARAVAASAGWHVLLALRRVHHARAADEAAGVQERVGELVGQQEPAPRGGGVAADPDDWAVVALAVEAGLTAAEEWVVG